MQLTPATAYGTSSVFREFHEDQRGAIMLMGLCMSCFLIGMLWYVLGVGDAIVFRDMMQEATDHAAFTSAAIHAKGMNFIAACNLILLALIALQVIFGIIYDVATLATIAACATVYGCPAAVRAWKAWRDVYFGYAKVVRGVGTVIHGLEVAAAYGYPYLGAAKGYNIGQDYGKYSVKNYRNGVPRELKVIALSPSMIPGSSLGGGLDKLFNSCGSSSSTQPSDSKLGLPVTAKPFDSVCDKLTTGIDGLLGFASESKVNKIVSTVLKARYCGGGDISGLGDLGVILKYIGSVYDEAAYNDWWEKDGPLVPWSGTKNGSKWQQIWAINVAPEYKDVNEHLVALAKRDYHVTQTASTSLYFAQAEFYFDCANTWENDDCNGDPELNNNAGYSLQWRARLRRAQIPSFGLGSDAQAIADIANGTANTLLSVANALGNVLSQTSQIPIVGNAIRGVVQPLVQPLIQGINSVIFPLQQVGNGLDQVANGAYH